MTANGQEKAQRQYFDKVKNQYPSNLVIKPPGHVLAEFRKIHYYLQLHNLSSVVDFGAGTGRLTIFLLKHRYKVFAVDLSEKSLRVLKNVANNLGYRQLKTATSLPENQCQAIVGADILHHVDMDVYLPLLNRSLIKNGRVIFSEPGAWNPSWYIYLSVTHSWRIEKGLLSCNIINLKKKLEHYGFSDIKIEGLGFLPRVFFQFSDKLCAINDVMGDWPIFKLFAYRYIICAQKNDQ
ncbi:hypothetical protein A3H86_04160 [Candidatus Roizmanbacteria bacterium RIFCSPLOWO2_02_FULL_41_9]|uniref:Methyltransferase type 11 domain-containing protein n=1 Tax=Candidatus Roizmanbacteria bacterium RIFCSPLOWO2_02_FULL_41_9 TaxID=1802077 RepID=A0A1F7JRB6_9BACT|nr:MAG: hypothetical protein A3H86_04160 [Candidatus Roizmanbacteria bacterium RIFCSPLOWO2_02_FULL_41_9]